MNIAGRSGEAEGAAGDGRAVGCRVGIDEVGVFGRQAINAPKWSINAGLEQVYNFANDGKLTFNADVRYQSSTFTGFEQLEGMKQKAFTTLDLQLAYAFPGDKLTVAAFGNNVTDEEVVGYSSPHPFGPGLIVNSLRPPRTYGVRAGYKF